MSGTDLAYTPLLPYAAAAPCAVLRSHTPRTILRNCFLLCAVLSSGMALFPMCGTALNYSAVPRAGRMRRSPYAVLSSGMALQALALCPSDSSSLARYADLLQA
eukprot:1998853-Rhodomonas_salina.1